jgi:hypothetical protein
MIRPSIESFSRTWSNIFASKYFMDSSQQLVCAGLFGNLAGENAELRSAGRRPLPPDQYSETN